MFTNIPAGVSSIRLIVTNPDGTTSVLEAPVVNGQAMFTFTPGQAGAYSFRAIALANGVPMLDAAGNELVIETGTFVETPPSHPSVVTPQHPTTGSASAGYLVGGIFAAAVGALLLINRNRRIVAAS